MSWNTRIFEPHRLPPHDPTRYRWTSPPLVRLFGALGGASVGLLAFHGVMAILNLDRSFLHADDWGFKELVTVAISLIGVLVGLIVGVGVGMSIEVRSARTNHMLTVLWHYAANGQILWAALLSLLLTRTLGKEAAIRLFEQLGPWHASLLIAGNCAFWCLAMAGYLLANKQQSLDSEPSFLPCLFVTVPLSILMGYIQFLLLGLPGNKWLIVGIVFALILPFLSAPMIDRDLRQRQEILTQ